MAQLYLALFVGLQRACDIWVESVSKPEVNFLFGGWLSIASQEREYVLACNFLEVRHRHYLVADRLIRDDAKSFIGRKFLNTLSGRVK